MSSEPDSSSPKDELKILLPLAKQGSTEAVGQVLEGCRQYLLLMANEELDPTLRIKLGPSDIVQDTFLKAQQAFAQFRGDKEADLLAWLRQILLNILADSRRRYQAAEKRDVHRERSFDEVSASELQASLGTEESPRAQMIAREEASRVREALKRLSEAEQQLLEWRNYELCNFAEMGRRLGKSEEAARKAWFRAVEQLERYLENPHESE